MKQLEKELPLITQQTNIFKALVDLKIYFPTRAECVSAVSRSKHVFITTGYKFLSKH